MSDKPHNPEPSNNPRPPRQHVSPPAPAEKPRPPAPTRPLTPHPADTTAGDLSDAGSALAGMQIVEDDDQILIPALAPEQLAAHAPYLKPNLDPRHRTLPLRRTLIPILLTCGVMLPTLAVLWFTTDTDSVVRNTGLWLPVTFLVLGGVFLLLAVLNMAQVRHMLNAPRSQ